MSVTADKVVVELEARLGKYNADVNAARANFDSNMGKIRNSAQATERQADISGARIGKAFGDELIKRASVAAVVTGLFKIGAAAAQVAREAEELDSAIGYTFGKNAGMIEAWADTTGAAMGRASTDLKQAALDFQTLFGPALGADAAAEMSKKFATLVQDLASFRNVSEDIVRQNLVSGLVGETEPLRKYGILINDNTVKTKALEMGLVSAGEEVNDYGKIVARAQLILEATATAQGDVARTAESTTNRMRSAKSATKELGEEIGKGLNPGLAALAGIWTQVAKAIEWAVKAQTNFNRVAGAVVKGVLAGTGQAMARWDYEQARKRAALDGRTLPAYEEIQSDSARGPRGRGRNRAALGLKPADDGANTPPDYAAPKVGGGGGRAGSKKDRYAGRLPSNILQAIKEGRLTEETARTAWPKGDFPLPGPPELFVAPEPAGGLIVAGNIDLSRRPIHHNADGSVSTVRSMSFGTDQGETLVPTVSENGSLLTEAEAIELFRKNGKHLGIFSTPEAATAYAIALHEAQAEWAAKSGGFRSLADPVMADVAHGYDGTDFKGGIKAVDPSGGAGFTQAGDAIAASIGPATEAYAALRQNFASSFADGAIQALESGDVGGALEQMLLQWGADGLRKALEGLGSTLFDAGSGGPLGGGGAGDIASAILKFIPGFASGTSSAPGGLAMVHKDEMIHLPRGSQVYTAAQTRAMGRGGGSQPVSVHISLAGANGDRAIMAYTEQAVQRGVSAALSAANRSETGRQVTQTFLGARPLT